MGQHFRVFAAGAAMLLSIGTWPSLLHAQVQSTSAIDAPTSGGPVQAGVNAWQSGDYAQAVLLWRPVALGGDADAQFNMGQAYKLGRGVDVDYAQALNWYRQAAAQGHIQAEDAMGMMLYAMGRQSEAMPLLARSAHRGEARALYLYGTALFNGDYVQKDWVRAYAMIKRASDKGLDRASASLAQMDGYVSAEDRQQGITMAARLASEEGTARLATVTGADRPASIRVPETPVSPTSAPAAPTTIHPAPARARTAAVSTPPAAAPAPRPAMVAGGVTGSWRILLGAFGSEAGARNLWNGLRTKFDGRQSYIERAGTIYRLQIGNYATRADAMTACAAVRPQACMPISR